MVAETELCNWPKCDCNIDFTEECGKGRPISQAELEAIEEWTRTGFSDVFQKVFGVDENGTPRPYNDNRVKVTKGAVQKYREPK